MNRTPESIAHVKPGDLVIDTNVRLDPRLDSDFVASVKQHGVIQPPVGWRDDAGAVHITVGQRRTLAAVQAKLATIPVVIRDQTAAETERILDQYAENEHRTPLTELEHARAYETLAGLGVSAGMIARRTNTAPQRVKVGLAAMASAPATKALEELPVTLEQAAALAEFEDEPEVVEHLRSVFTDRPEQIDHVIVRARQDRDLATAKERMIAEIAAEGLELVPVPDYYDAKNRELPWIYTDAELTIQATEDDARGRGLAVALTQAYGWNDETRRSEPSWARKWVVRDFAANGFYSRERGGPGGATKGPATDEQKQERKLAREQKKAWTASSEVRTKWITELLAKKTAPRGADAFVALHVAMLLPRESAYRDRAVIFLGLGERDTSNGYVEPGDYDKTLLGRELLKNPQRATMIALGIAIAGVEAVATNARNDLYSRDYRVGPYLEQLSAWGYTLSDAEQHVVALAKARKAKQK